MDILRVYLIEGESQYQNPTDVTQEWHKEVKKIIDDSKPDNVVFEHEEFGGPGWYPMSHKRPDDYISWSIMTVYYDDGNPVDFGEVWEALLAMDEMPRMTWTNPSYINWTKPQ